MVKLNDDMKNLVSRMNVFMFATASASGEPNVVPIKMLIVQPDSETIWIVDNFMNKTLANVKENPRASFSVWDPECELSYQIKGDIDISDSGADYKKAVEIAHSKKKELPAKNLLKMRVTDVYSVTPGPTAGLKLL